MKRLVLSIMMMTMVVPAVVFSQEFEPEQMDRRMDMRAREMEMREREMRMQQRQAEMDLQRERQELELEGRRIELERARHAVKYKPQLLLLLVLVVHILCAVWVYQDIQKRTGESGIWVVIALLTGLLGTLVYAVVRLSGGRKKNA